MFDVLSSFPGVLLAMLVVTFLGQGMLNIAIAVGIAGIPKFGRVIRAQTQLVRDADYVTHAVVYGLSRWQIFIQACTAQCTGRGAGNRNGLYRQHDSCGVRPQLSRARPAPPTPEWGVMLAESRDVLRVAWWPGVFPGLAITLTVLAFTWVGNALQKKFEGRLA